MASFKDTFAVISRDEAFSLAKKFKEHLEKKGVPIVKMYLYGSYAKDNPRYGSDIDICVISPNFQDKLGATLFLGREALHIDSKIEPVGYSPESFEDWIPLVWEIKQHGISVN